MSKKNIKLTTQQIDALIAETVKSLRFTGYKISDDGIAVFKKGKNVFIINGKTGDDGITLPLTMPKLRPKR